MDWTLNPPVVAAFVWESAETAMPQGDKSKYTGKQQRQADHIAESYEARGLPKDEAKARAWATVNKEDGGGKKAGGSGRGPTVKQNGLQK